MSQQVLPANPPTLRQRGIEVLVDYLVIVVYLAGLAAIAVTVYFASVGGIPGFTMWQAQGIACFTSVLPVMLAFTHLDFSKARGSYGKRVARLRVNFKTASYWRSLVRNSVKFLPWQLGHMGVIDGLYSDFSTISSQIFVGASLLLAAVLVLPMLIRKDRRHLGDLLAGTQVVTNAGQGDPQTT